MNTPMDTQDPAGFSHFLLQLSDDLRAGKVSRMQALHIIESLLITLDELRRKYNSYSPDSTETVRRYMLSSLDDLREALTILRECNDGQKSASGKLDHARALIEQGSGLLLQVELLAAGNEAQLRED